MKRIAGILLLVVIASVLIGTVSAETVTVSGEQFNIPDGYVEGESPFDEPDGVGTSTEVKMFVNGDKNITITVWTNTGPLIDLVPDAGEVEKTINGVEGYYDSETNTFKYISSNDNCKSVTVHADGADLEDIIVA